MENTHRTMICRLCLNIINNNYIPVEEIIIGKLEIVLIELDRNITIRGSVICSTCSEFLEKYYCLRYQLYKAEESERNLRSENNLDLREVLMWTDNSHTEIKDEISDIIENCKICGKHLNEFETWENSTATVTETLEGLFSHLGFPIAPNSQICKSCVKILYELTYFKDTCMSTQNVINNYCNEFSIKHPLEIDLRHVRFHQIYSTSSCKRQISADEGMSYVPDYQLTCTKTDSIFNLKAPLQDNEKIDDNGSNFKLLIYDEIEVKPITRNGIRMYICPKCNDAVKNIEQHIVQHANILPNIKFKCTKCDYSHESKVNLNNHMASHNLADKSRGVFYRCDQCPFRSKQKGNLKSHSLTHKSPEEINMFKCHLCKYQTRQKGNLQTHLLIHEKPENIVMFKCNLCSFQARQKGNLQTHMLRKHCKIKDELIDSALFFKCQMCSYKSKQKNYLKRHLLKSHNQG